MRDYGTGQWEGGDPDCDHAQRYRGQTGLTKPNPNWNIGGPASLVSHVEPYGDRCGKCGAARVDQQIGLEATVEEYVQTMVDVFREVRRVLRRDGTCWVNLGDSYAATTTSDRHMFQPTGPKGTPATTAPAQIPTMRTAIGGLKPKDLVGIPWRVAFALQADGWWLRSDIVWAKPNPMPESVTDRPTKAHEYVFLLTKAPRYYFNADAVREPGGYQLNSFRDEKYVNDNAKTTEHPHRYRQGAKVVDHPNGGRNIRSVWNIATQPYPEAHFATFPEALPERCIRAGTSERGCCPVCGAPWLREATVDYEDAGRNNNSLKTKAGGDAVAAMSARPYETRKLKHVTTTGWRPSCGCDREPVPCVVLDPFSGSGTVALVARKLGRRSIGIELNPEYAALCARRLQQLSLFAGAPA